MATSRRVRIADVAARAGVGVGTVSRVLNGSPHVRERTRERVLEAISQTRYRPSRLAAGLSRGTPGSVAIIVPFLTRPSVVARLAGVIEVLDAEGYDTIVCNVETLAQRDRQVRMFADGHRAAGAVVLSLRLSAAQLADLAVAGMPVVAVDAAIRGVPGTVIDDVRGGMLATTHLLGLGHRRIGFISDTGRVGGLAFSSTTDRLRGYCQALSQAGIPADRGAHPARPAWLDRRRADDAEPAAHARPADGDLRRLRHPGGRRPVRGRDRRGGGSSPAVGDRLRRHRDRGAAGAVHRTAAVARKRRARRGTTVPPAARRRGEPVARGTPA
jgi:DNA-binding LacI/PurR family transcriptional regulator